MEKEVIKFDAELYFQETKLENISCEIIIPELPNEEIYIESHLYQSTENFGLLLALPNEFSLKSLPSEFSRQEISVDKAYRLSVKADTNQKYITLRARVLDLKIRRFISPSFDSIPEIKKNVKNFYFLLTESIHLRASSFIQHSFDGSTTIKTTKNKSFEIREGLRLKFISYYFHYSDPNKKNKHISESVLAAELSDFVEQKTDEELFSDIDFFLRLVSFSERRRIACYGYKGNVFGITSEIIDFYKYGSFVPEENFDHSFNDVLIDGQYFENFVVEALKSLRECTFKEYLFEAIIKATPNANSFLESEYLTYYSALENLVNGFRDTQNLHLVLDEENYKKFSNDIKKFIGKHDLLKDGSNIEENQVRKSQRRLIYEKSQN
jgi:hypothetical protein